VRKIKKGSKPNSHVSVDRRRGDERRGAVERRKSEAKVGSERRTSQRRAVVRRRQIDPTTCERDYTSDEIEFMQAMDAYKRSSGRMFPTCSEVLEVLRGLGYEKRPFSLSSPAVECSLGVSSLTASADEDSEPNGFA
jgi:hypothetical protein